MNDFTADDLDEFLFRTGLLKRGFCRFCISPRVDGKSPVEYITDEKIKKNIRRSATTLIENSKLQLTDIKELFAA